jgi:hypothetical protein
MFSEALYCFVVSLGNLFIALRHGSIIEEGAIDYRLGLKSYERKKTRGHVFKKFKDHKIL